MSKSDAQAFDDLANWLAEQHGGFVHPALRLSSDTPHGCRYAASRLNKTDTEAHPSCAIVFSADALNRLRAEASSPLVA